MLAQVIAPSGARREVPLEWSVARDGDYRARFVPSEPGMHTLRIVQRAAGIERTSPPAFVDVAPSREEYFAAGTRSDLLRGLATETGGKSYTPETARTLPEDLRYARAGVTTAERKELWDMPATFLLLGTLLGAEWGYRRHRGLA